MWYPLFYSLVGNGGLFLNEYFWNRYEEENEERPIKESWLLQGSFLFEAFSAKYISQYWTQDEFIVYFCTADWLSVIYSLT